MSQLELTELCPTCDTRMLPYSLYIVVGKENCSLARPSEQNVWNARMWYNVMRRNAHLRTVAEVLAGDGGWLAGGLHTHFMLP